MFGRQFFFFLFVLLISGYAFYEYKRAEKEKVILQKKSSLILESLEDIKEIKITQEKKNLIVSFESGKWILEKPLYDLIDSQAFYNWFDDLKKEQPTPINVDKPVDWKSYHLDRPLTLQWTLKSGGKKSLFVSSKSNFDGKYFIKKDEKLFLGKSFLTEGGINLLQDQLRSKRIIHSFGHPKQIRIKGKDNLILDWKDYKWTLKKDPHFPLDGSRVDGFWTDLTSLKAKKIVGKATASNLKKYGLVQPPFQIVLQFKDDKKIVLLISSPQKNKVFILNSNRNYILEISEENLKKILLEQETIRKKTPKEKPKEKKDNSLNKNEKNSSKKINP